MTAAQLTLSLDVAPAPPREPVDDGTILWAIGTRVTCSGTPGVVVGRVLDWPLVKFTDDGSYIGGWTLCVMSQHLKVVE